MLGHRDITHAFGQERKRMNAEYSIVDDVVDEYRNGKFQQASAASFN